MEKIHEEWLHSLADFRSALERWFLDAFWRLLPSTGRGGEADAGGGLHRRLFYAPNVCVFCDSSVYNHLEQKVQDEMTRRELQNRGYWVIMIRYDRDIGEQITRDPDVFGGNRARR